jgi:chromosome partitioning protein
MPVISFVSSKGGAGKTTSAIILGTALARNHAVTMIDADEALRLNRWANLNHDLVSHIDIKDQTKEYGIHDTIDKARDSSDFTIIDTKGEASRLNSHIIAESDLVIVVTGADVSEAHDAVETIGDILLESRSLRRPINYAVLFTRIHRGNQSDVARGVVSDMRNQFDCFDVDIPFLSGTFAKLHDQGGSVWELPIGSSNLALAKEVSELFAINTKAMLEWHQTDIKRDMKEELNYGQ